MTIHHSQIKKAEKMGVALSEDGDIITGFWAQRGLKIAGASTSDVLAQFQAAQAIYSTGDLVLKSTDNHAGRLFLLFNTSNDNYLQHEPTTPVMLHRIAIMRKGEGLMRWDIHEPETVFPTETVATVQDVADTLDAQPEPTIEQLAGAEPFEDPAPVSLVIKRNEAGIALDGAVAYREGTPAGDNPYSTEGTDEEYDLAMKWDEAWDEAADAAEANGEEQSKSGSVVKNIYRQRYAEMGHPTHCGDWLAELLNGMCGGKAATDLALFEEICSLNNVNTSKYRRDGIGWQGRIRMTGRNLLAKQVFLQGGRVNLPNNETAQAPAEWLAAQRFKMPKAQQ